MLLPQAHLHAHAVAPGPGGELIMSVETTGADEAFTIPCADYGTYDATIDWGDGQQSVITAYNDPDLAHTYATPGTHTIEITGDLPHIRFAGAGDAAKMRTITQWGDGVIQKVDYAFQGCANLDVDAPDALVPVDPSAIYAFYGVGLISDTTNFDLSAITNGYGMFYSLPNVVHGIDSSDWNLNALVDGRFFMSGLYSTPIDVSTWGLANLQRGDYMFSSNYLLDSDMSAWNLSSILNTDYMFLACSGVSTPNVDSLLQALYTHRMTVGWATPAMDISSMASPSGVYQYANPPTTGLEYAYWLEQDPDGEGFNTWTLTI